MKVLDPGHDYELASFDGGEPVRLTFVKRNDPPEKYPGNANAYPGTQIQEVLRALIDRAEYVNNQIPSQATESVIHYLKMSIWMLEHRHAERHGYPESMNIYPVSNIDLRDYCKTCGHIECYCEPAKSSIGKIV